MTSDLSEEERAERLYAARERLRIHLAYAWNQSGVVEYLARGHEGHAQAQEIWSTLERVLRELNGLELGVPVEEGER